MNAKPYVYLDELPWDIRSRNTDWRYVRYALPRISEYEPNVSFAQQSSRWITWRGNCKTICAALGRRIGISLRQYTEDTSKLAQAELQRSGANVIFAHRAYPVNAGNVPVIWQSAIIYPEMLRSYGVSDGHIQEQIRVKGLLFLLAAAVQVSTDAEVLRHNEMFPESAGKFIAVPMFTPDVRACNLSALNRHRNAAPIRLLFVGNDAYRKGLDVLIEAFVGLPATLRERTKLTVISNFDRRSFMDVPISEHIHVLRGATHAQVMEEMSRSHIFVNVARLESYGVVFHEAMSQGLACLAPDWEVQRELFDNGNAGMNLKCEARVVRSALERLIDDDELRYRFGVAAWNRFQQKYEPAIVARRYAELFREVAQS